MQTENGALTDMERALLMRLQPLNGQCVKIAVLPDQAEDKAFVNRITESLRTAFRKEGIPNADTIEIRVFCQ